MITGYFEERENFIFANLYGKVLDIGYAGWEEFHEKMKEKAEVAEVFGIDIEVRKDVENTVRAYGDHLPFMEDTFDVIVAGEIIEHVDEPFNFLKDCIRVLKPGGKIIITTPNIHALYWFIRHAIGKPGISSHPQHIYAWDIPLLERLLVRAGLEVKEVGYINICDKKKIPHYIVYRVFKQLAWHIYAMAIKP